MLLSRNVHSCHMLSGAAVMVEQLSHSVINTDVARFIPGLCACDSSSAWKKKMERCQCEETWPPVTNSRTAKLLQAVSLMVLVADWGAWIANCKGLTHIAELKHLAASLLTSGCAWALCCIELHWMYRKPRPFSKLVHCRDILTFARCNVWCDASLKWWVFCPLLCLVVFFFAMER